MSSDRIGVWLFLNIMSISNSRRHGFQVSVLGSADPGTTAYDRAGEAGEALARIGVTVVSGCGSPATRVAAELLPEKLPTHGRCRAHRRAWIGLGRMIAAVCQVKFAREPSFSGSSA